MKASCCFFPLFPCEFLASFPKCDSQGPLGEQPIHQKTLNTDIATFQTTGKAKVF
jgi:hypothetical protein